MMNRLKTTVFLSFLLMRASIIALFITEAITTALMILITPFTSNRSFFLGSELPVMILLLIFGISFYKKHTGFCLANAVWMKYRAVSAAISAGSVCLFAAVFDNVMRALTLTSYSVSVCEYMRVILNSSVVNESFIPFTIVESLFFYAAIFSFGYFLGALSFSRGEGFMMNSCVRKESRTHKLAKQYIETLLCDNQNRLTERDVTKMGLLPMDENAIMRRDVAIAKSDFTGADADYANEFADADSIIIAAPYWDCSFPSFLKLYFEHIMIRNIVFGYSPDGNILKLCKANKLVYIATSGGYIKENSGLRI